MRRAVSLHAHHTVPLLPKCAPSCIRKLCQQKCSQHSVSGNTWMAHNVHCCLFVLMFLLSLSRGKVSSCLLQFCPILRFSAVNSSLWIPFPKNSCKWHFWATFAIAPFFSSQRLLLFTPFSDSVASIDTALLRNCPSVQSKERCKPRYTIKKSS